jgi:hypothetical protein
VTGLTEFGQGFMYGLVAGTGLMFSLTIVALVLRTSRVKP